jgi:putative ABC transport system ATP-binding protein
MAAHSQESVAPTESSHSHHSVSPYSLIRSLLQSERNEVAVILTYGLGVGLLSLAIPVSVQTLVNNVNFGALNQAVVVLVLAVFLVLSAAACMRAIQIRIVEQLQKRFFAQIALELAFRLPRLSTDAKSKSRFPELVNRFFDVLTVQKSSATLLLEGFALALQIGLGLLLLGFYHWFLLGFAILLVLSVAAVLFILGRGAVSTSIDESVQKYRVAAWLEEIALRPQLFRTKDAREMALKQADGVVAAYLEARGKHFSILYRQVLGSLTLQAVASSALLGIGAWLVVNNQLTLGQLVAAEIVVTTALTSLAKFQKHLEAFYDLVAALDKLDGLLELPLERMGGEQLPPSDLPARLDVSNLEFAYGNNTFFDRFSFELAAGRHLALLGGKASGKTTLIDLLYGNKTAKSGTILIDSRDYRDLSPETLREQVALIRGLDFVPDTVFENVRMGRLHLTADDVRDALTRVGLLEDILNFPDGLQTVIGGDGSPLSVSQSHALVLARTIIGQPRLLLIDEALDGLDDESRSRALRVVLDPKASWTLILATHNSEIAKQCELTVSLDALKQKKAAS